MDMIIGRKPSAGPDASDPSQAGSAFIKDGDQASFMHDVIEQSRSTPVLVDFWATWCGPCKQLTPALERVTRAAGGRVHLVKIDIDKNRSLVAQLTQLGLPLQSVPTVAAFWQGQIADLFQGALPESEIKRFVETLLKNSGGSMPTADLLAQARAALEEGTPELAADAFSALLQEEPENPDAWGGLVRALLALDQDDEAAETLAQVPASIASHAEIVGATSAVALAAQGRQAGSQLAELERRLAADPSDHEARHDLALALNGLGRRQEAADALLSLFKADRAWGEDAARKQLLKFFESWGLSDPASIAARRKLSALLFS